MSDITFTFEELPERPVNKQGKLVTGVRFYVTTKREFCFSNESFSRSTEQEEEDIKRDIEDADRGEYATDEEMEVIFKKYRV